MPRFFIDTSDGNFLARDEVGHDFPDLQAAKQAAVSALPDIAREELPDGDERRFSAVVRDQDGAAVLQASLTLSITRSPPTTH